MSGSSTLINKVSAKLEPIALKVARKLGYKTVEEAEKKAPAALQKGVEEAEYIARRNLDEPVRLKEPQRYAPVDRAAFEKEADRFNGETGFTLGDSRGPDAEDFNPDLANMYDTRTGFLKTDPDRLPAVSQPRTIDAEYREVPVGGQSVEPTRNKGKLLAGAAGATAFGASRADTEEPADLNDQRAPGGAEAGPSGSAQPPRTLQDRVSNVKQESSGVGPVANAELYGAALDSKKEQDAFDRSLQPLPGAPSRAEVNRRNADYEAAIKALKRDEVDTSGLEAKMKEARQAYKEQKDINRWSEVAQMLTNSITNYAAAVWGAKHGTGTVGLPDFAASDRDYRGRTKDARDEFQMETDLIDKERRGKFEKAQLAYEEKKDKAKGVKELADIATDMYGRDIQKYQTDVNYAREVNRDIERDKTEAARLKEAEKKNDTKLAQIVFDNMQQEERFIGSEASDLQKQASEIQKLVDEASSSSSKKADAALGALTQRAGLTEEQKDELADKPGSMFSVPAGEQANKIKQTLLAPIQQQLAATKQRLDYIRAQKARAGTVLGIPSQGDPAPASSSTTPPVSGMIRMKHKQTGAVKEVTREQAAKLPASEFEEVK